MSNPASAHWSCVQSLHIMRLMHISPAEYCAKCSWQNKRCQSEWVSEWVNGIAYSHLTFICNIFKNDTIAYYISYFIPYFATFLRPRNFPSDALIQTESVGRRKSVILCLFIYEKMYLVPETGLSFCLVASLSSNSGKSPSSGDRRS